MLKSRLLTQYSDHLRFCILGLVVLDCFINLFMNGREVNLKPYSHRYFLWRTPSSFTWLNQDYPWDWIDFCSQISFRCLKNVLKIYLFSFQTLTHGWLTYTFLVFLSFSFWIEPYLIMFSRCQSCFFTDFHSMEYFTNYEFFQHPQIFNFWSHGWE